LENIFSEEYLFRYISEKNIWYKYMFSLWRKAHALNGYIRMTCTLVLFTNSIVLNWVFRVSTCTLFVSHSLYHLDALSMTFSWVVMDQNHRLIKVIFRVLSHLPCVFFSCIVCDVSLGLFVYCEPFLYHLDTY